MATPKLSGKDRASDKLLNRIAEHIDADRMQSIASNLDMKDSMFSRIKADFPGETQNQAFKVSTSHLFTELKNLSWQNWQITGTRQVIKEQTNIADLLSDLKNQTIVSSCVTHILPSCGYFKGQEQICFNPTSWHLVTYNFLRGHKF